MKFLNFFQLLWVTLALLDPDPNPLTRLNPDPIRIQIRNPVCRYVHIKHSLEQIYIRKFLHLVVISQCSVTVCCPDVMLPPFSLSSIPTEISFFLKKPKVPLSNENWGGSKVVTNRTVLLKCLVGKFFVILNGHRHESSKKAFFQSLNNILNQHLHDG